MSFRRIPFQFTTTDPAERQRELEKRFGLPSKSKMHIGCEHPLAVSSDYRDPSACSSPRLQHRVPIFVEGYDQPIRSSVDSSNSVPENKKSNVRVIPIEIEGAEAFPSTRHRTFSGPAGLAKKSNEDLLPQRDDASPLKRSMQDLSKPSKMKATTGPKVYNIPIKVEGVDTNEKKPKPEKVKSPIKKDHSRANGCNVSHQVQEIKPASEQKAEPKISKEQNIEINITKLLKKIENILEELKSYYSGVREFSGTGKDKQYRYLDEMLTRCMLRLDDIDTVGNDKVRSARKNAVKEVQACIDELERKVNTVSEVQDETSSHVILTEDLKHGATDVLEHEDATEAPKCEVEAKILQPETVMKVLEHADNESVSNLRATKSSEKQEYEGQDERNINVLSKEGSVIKVSKHERIAEVSGLEPEIMTKVLENAYKTEDCERTDVINVDMVEVPDSTAVISSAAKDNSVCTVSGIKVSEKPHSEVNVEGSSEVSEIEMMEDSSSQDIISEKQYALKVPECPSTEDLIEGKISQDSDVEMKEIENSLNEVKEKTINCGSVKLENIPVEDAAVYAVVGGEVSPAGHCVSHSNCPIKTDSSRNVENI